MGILNIISLILGIVAWSLPLISLTKIKNINSKNFIIFSMLSFAFTVLSLYFQFVYINYLLKKDDWAAIYDTNNAVLFCCTVLITVTFGLNLINFIILKFNKSKQL